MSSSTTVQSSQSVITFLPPGLVWSGLVWSGLVWSGPTISQSVRQMIYSFTPLLLLYAYMDMKDMVY